jgi:hypothetical protein
VTDESFALADLSKQQEIYQAFMNRLVRLIDAPWDATLVHSPARAMNPGAPAGMYP